MRHYLIHKKVQSKVLFIFLLSFLLTQAVFAQQNPLPSWRDAPNRAAIIGFVQDVTDIRNPQYIPRERRIATFDFDGTIAGESSGRNEHPEYVASAFQPMREVIFYLRDNGFTCWVVSGSHKDRLVKYVPKNYGIPAEHIIGAVGHEQKVVAIKKIIGERPIFAAGNNANDYAMMIYSRQQPRRTLQLLIHHDDAQREVSYAKKSEVEEADLRHWNLVSIKNDWRRVFWRFESAR